MLLKPNPNLKTMIMKAQLEQRLKAQERIPSRPKDAGGTASQRNEPARNLAAHHRRHASDVGLTKNKAHTFLPINDYNVMRSNR